MYCKCCSNHVTLFTLLYFRVVKQALRCSGANVTDKHVKDISMCALFLLEAAKKCDAVFGVPPNSTAHSVRDSKSDVQKILHHLLEKEVTTEITSRTAPGFEDPTVNGLDTLTKGEWLQKQLQSKFEDNLQSERDHNELDLNYELADT